MIVGIIYLELLIPHTGSLKEKRSVVNSYKKRIQNKFNVSIAEVDFQDKWQRAALGISFVGNDKAQLDSLITKLENFTESDFRVTLTKWEVRYI
ncbi:DUF503 domain-containing protein [candidate division KSB1 bacterium]